MPNGFLPNTDPALLRWSGNFSERISADPQGYGLSVQQAADYRGLHENFAAAMEACQPQIRSMTATVAKNAARSALKQTARRLVSLINGQIDVTDTQRIELGLTVRSRPTRAAAPDMAPVVGMKAIEENRVLVSLRSPTLNAKPPGVIGATLFMFVGEQPPASAEEWQFVGNSGRSRICCPFPASLPPGTRVWITARWLNGRLQFGPLSTPRMAHLHGAVLDLPSQRAA